MSRATGELYFFGTEKENSCKSQFQKFLDRRRSFRGAISNTNPDIIKSVIASGLTNQRDDNANQIDPNKCFSVPSSHTESQSLFPTLPLLTPSPRLRATSENGPETDALTIFYNGTVSIFNVPRDKAENILQLAVEGSSKTLELTDSRMANPDQQQLLETLKGDLPIARRKSLQIFLEKRKERLASVSPYAC